ncbi:MAG: ABC transporter permease [Gemmatimonadota bacterium]
MNWWPSPLERLIAMRYLRGQRGTRTASLQTIVAIAGITVGVAALIVVLGVMNGLRDDLRDRILVASPHIRVLTFGDNLRIPDWENALGRVRKIPGVVAAAPEVITGTVATNASGYPELAKVAGLEVGVGTHDITGLDSAMVEGSLHVDIAPGDSVDGNVVLGDRLASKLSVQVGDELLLVSPRSAQRSRITGGYAPQYWSARVTGTFRTGMFIYDDEFMVMDRASAQRFAGIGADVSAIAVRVNDPDQAPAVAESIMADLGYPYRVETWQIQNESLFKALQLEKLGMGLVIFFIMIVAAFNIVGTLTMVVTFKTREIGILQAMGMPGQSIARIFLAQGAFVGIVGTTFGVLLGLLLAFVGSGFISLDPSVYFIDHLPIRVEALDVAIIAAAAVGLAVVAGIHPARRAAQLTPVDAVRAE